MDEKVIHSQRKNGPDMLSIYFIGLFVAVEKSNSPTDFGARKRPSDSGKSSDD